MADIHFRIPCSTDMAAFVEWMDEFCPKWFINQEVGFAYFLHHVPEREKLSTAEALVSAAKMAVQFSKYGYTDLGFLEIVTTSANQCMLAKLTWC